jgi:hypothetical protein
MSVLIFNFVSKSRWEHLTFAAKLEIGAKSQEPGARSQEEQGRSQKKCFYKYEMLASGSPSHPPEKGDFKR